MAVPLVAPEVLALRPDFRAIGLLVSGADALAAILPGAELERLPLGRGG